MAYRVCPNCGAHLDLEEKCDCVEDLYEKKEFVKIFKILLLKADVDLSDLQLIDNETVEASYIGGGKRRINIAADSRIGIIRDVARHII